jgi:hypothetical protein
MKPPRIELLASRLGSHEVVEALDVLREDAEAGRLIGIAFVAHFKGNVYVPHVDGASYRNPTFALGMVEMLAEHIKDLIRMPK